MKGTLGRSRVMRGPSIFRSVLNYFVHALPWRSASSENYGVEGEVAIQAQHRKAAVAVQTERLTPAHVQLVDYTSACFKRKDQPRSAKRPRFRNAPEIIWATAAYRSLIRT